MEMLPRPVVPSRDGIAHGRARAPGVDCRKAPRANGAAREDNRLPRETPVMQRTSISVPKLAIRIGVAGLLLATAAAKLQAQQAGEPPPPWKQGMSAAADSKLAPIAPPPLPTAQDKLPLDKLKLKNGFKIEVYAAGVPNARTLRLGDKGTVFVS